MRIASLDSMWDSPLKRKRSEPMSTVLITGLVQLIAPTGDDLVIGDWKVALPDKEWLADLGVSVSMPKSLVNE